MEDAEKILGYLRETDTLIGHNGNFDIETLRIQFTTLDLSSDFKTSLPSKTVCTQQSQ
jgi:hypothetical protein